MTTASLPSLPDGTTYPAQLQKLAEGNPDKPAYVFFDAQMKKFELTRKDVWDYSRKYAAILKSHGVQKGHIVCNTLANSPERLLSALGTVVAGAISMNAQALLADGEDLIHVCRIAKCSYVIVDSSQEKGAWTILERLQYTDDSTGEIRFTGLPDLTKVLHFKCYTYKDDERSCQDLELGVGEIFEEPNIREEDTAFIFCTSGTTGFSKLVPHSHRNCLQIGKMLGHFGFGITSEESKFFSANHLGWLGGFPGPYLAFGCTRFLLDLSKEKEYSCYYNLIYKILNMVKLDAAFVLPSGISSLREMACADGKSKRLCPIIVTGGSPLITQQVTGFEDITDSISCCYALSECGFVSALHLKRDTLFEDYCVGLPLPVEGLEVKIVDDNQRELPLGQIGHVTILSPTPTSGYLNDTEKTNVSKSKDGAFIPGDIGYIDEKGYLFILGRAQDAINFGAYIYYPGWLEARFQKCPGVKDVVMVGVPHPIHIEEICACIIASKNKSLNIEQLKEYCDRLMLTDKTEDMTASVNHFLFFDAFPYNRNGKLNRRLLRLEACDRLGVKAIEKTMR